MLTKQTAAMRVSRAMAAAEASADELALRIAELQTSMLAMRRETDIPARCAQAAFARLAKANELAVSATTTLHCVHGELSKSNFEVKALPDSDGDCPWPTTAQGDEDIAA